MLNLRGDHKFGGAENVQYFFVGEFLICTLASQVVLLFLTGIFLNVNFYNGTDSNGLTKIGFEYNTSKLELYKHKTDMFSRHFIAPC